MPWSCLIWKGQLMLLHYKPQPEQWWPSQEWGKHHLLMWLFNSLLEDLLGKGVTVAAESQQESINSFLLLSHASTAWGKLCATNCLLCLISFSCFWLFLVSVQPQEELGSCCGKSDWADRADQFLSQFSFCRWCGCVDFIEPWPLSRTWVIWSWGWSSWDAI